LNDTAVAATSSGHEATRVDAGTLDVEAANMAERRAVRRGVAAWIANDLAWGLVLAWTIRRHRDRRGEASRS
jgi:hypothetical protein